MNAMPRQTVLQFLSSGAVAPNNVTCAGKTMLLNGNIRIQANSQGVITAIGVVPQFEIKGTGYCGLCERI